MLKERGSYNHDIGEQYGAEHQELGEILYPVYFLPVKKGFSCNMEPLPQPPFFFGLPWFWKQYRGDSVLSFFWQKRPWNSLICCFHSLFSTSLK